MMNWNQLSDAERTRLTTRVVIAKDDPHALCNPAGWEDMQRIRGLASTVQPDVPNAGYYFSSARHDEKKNVYVEAERAIDARAFAERILGVSQVYISHLASPPKKPLPRWQTKWVGNASSNTRRQVARFIESEGSSVPWREIHLL